MRFCYWNGKEPSKEVSQSQANKWYGQVHPSALLTQLRQHWSSAHGCQDPWGHSTTKLTQSLTKPPDPGGEEGESTERVTLVARVLLRGGLLSLRQTPQPAAGTQGLDLRDYPGCVLTAL